MKESNTVCELQMLARRASRNLAEEYLPTSAEHHENGLRRARELTASGYNLLVMTTHPSETDEPREYAEFWRYAEFVDREIHVPCASDQNTLLLNTLARANGVKLYSVVTNDVVKRNGNVRCDKWEKDDDALLWRRKRLPQGHGNIGYFRGVKRAVATESDPAVIFLAPDAGRRPTLATPDTRSAEFLMTAMGDNKFAVLFIGVEIDDVTNYAKNGGKNFGSQYTLHFGNCFKDTEVLAELENFKRQWFEQTGTLLLPVREKEKPETVRRDRPFYGAEQWMYTTQFPDLVPEEYKPSPTA